MLRSWMICPYFSPNMNRAINLRRMRWMGHLARMGEKAGPFRVCWRNLRTGDHLEELDVDGRIILKCNLKNSVGNTCTGLIWLRIGTSGRIL
jgi:hypothetical protein